MKKLYLLLQGLLISCSLIYGQNITGTWSGDLSIQGMKLPIIFNIVSENDSLIVTMDSPMQKAKNIPTTYAKFEDDKLSIKAIQLMMQYDGSMMNDSLIDGTFTQGGTTFPLILKKGEVKMRRPQEPIPPFPYNSEDVFFENKTEGFNLAGTFTYPKDGVDFPSVVLITGSGSQDRNEEILGHKPFLVLSDYLTRNGIAVLRFDDRGVGESKGEDRSKATSKDFSTDVRAAMEYLKSRTEVDTNKIGLIGHSEGGCIAFMLAAEYDDVAFVVSMAGGAIRGDSLMKEQRFLIGTKSGLSTEQISKNEELIAEILSYIKGKTDSELKNGLDSFVDNTLIPILSTFPKGSIPSKEKLKSDVMGIASPWMQYFMNYDPEVDLKKVKCPIFAINGENDLQVLASSNLGSVKRNAPHATIKEYEGLNHLFQTSKTGLIQEYAEIEETIAPQVLKDISDWINQTVN